MGCGAALVRRLGEVDLSPPSVAFAWLGQHGFLIRFPEGWLLVDAYLSPSPARRFPPALDPEDVAVVSAVLGSHDHSDHVDRPVWPHLTCLYEGLTSRLCAERPDILFLPINGRDAERYRRGCLGNMTYQEAADLAGAVRPRLVVPTHFDMFAGNSENPALFADYMAVKHPSVPVWIPRQGDVYRHPGGPVERMVG